MAVLAAAAQYARDERRVADADTGAQRSYVSSPLRARTAAVCLNLLTEVVNRDERCCSRRVPEALPYASCMCSCAAAARVNVQTFNARHAFSPPCVQRAINAGSASWRRPRVGGGGSRSGKWSVRSAVAWDGDRGRGYPSVARARVGRSAASACLHCSPLSPFARSPPLFFFARGGQPQY